MQCRFLIFTPSYTDEFGEHKEWSKEILCPYSLHQKVYYCYKRFRKWVIRKEYIGSFWTTNITGVELSNGWKVSEHEYEYLFENLDDAKNYCVKKNNQEKVKVFNV